MHHCICWRAVARMNQAELQFECVKYSFYDEPSAQQELIDHWHEIVFHIPAYASDQMQASAPQLGKQVFGDIPLVCKQFPFQPLGHGLHHGPVIDIARCDLKRNDLAFIVDDDMQFHPVEPAHCCSSPLGKTSKGFVSIDPSVMTDRQMRAVSNIDACFLARQMMQQHTQWHEQAWFQGNKPAIAGQITKQLPVMAAYAIQIIQLEATKAADMKEHHDKQHLRQVQFADTLALT